MSRDWKKLLRKHHLLLLPSAPDALTAKLIEQAGFPAYQIGGFASMARASDSPTWT
jgi:2-methylisocitrate lyase-like PEP mutase family enzyme